MTANELQLAKAFRDAGFSQDKAEAVSETIFAAIRDNVATKADLTIMEQRFRSEIQSLKIWGGGVAVAVVTATVTALHYWPPHS